MEKINDVKDLFRYLQDPHLVARFQHICGVRGTFSRTASAGSNSKISGGEEADQDPTRSLNNTAFHHSFIGESKSKNYAVKGGGEGGKVETTRAGVRRRVTGYGDPSENPHFNGTLLTLPGDHGETVTTVVGSNGRSPAAEIPPGQRGHSPTRPVEFSRDTEEKMKARQL